MWSFKLKCNIEFLLCSQNCQVCVEIPTLNTGPLPQHAQPSHNTCQPFLFAWWLWCESAVPESGFSPPIPDCPAGWSKGWCQAKNVAGPSLKGKQAARGKANLIASPSAKARQVIECSVLQSLRLQVQWTTRRADRVQASAANSIHAFFRGLTPSLLPGTSIQTLSFHSLS